MTPRANATGTAAQPPASHRAIRERGEAAIEKQRTGKTLTASEVNALAKLERLNDQERIRAAYQRCTGEILRGLIGCSRMQLIRYQRYGAPRNDDGSYSLGNFFPWLLDHERQRLAAEKAPAINALEQIRLLELERRQRQDALERGELTPMEHVEKVFRELASQMREELLSWGNIMAPRLAGLEPRAVQSILSEEIRKLLERIAGRMVQWGGRKRERTAKAGTKERSGGR